MGAVLHGGRAYAIDEVLRPNACPKSVVDVQPRTARVVVNPSDLKPELFASAVVRGQGEQVCALNHISVETGGKPPTQASNLVKRPSPLSSQQVGCRFYKTPGCRIDARARLPLEGKLLVHLTFKIQVGQPKKRVRQIHGNGVPSNQVFVVHHVTQSNFSGVPQSGLGIHLAVVRLVE